MNVEEKYAVVRQRVKKGRRHDNVMYWYAPHSFTNGPGAAHEWPLLEPAEACAQDEKAIGVKNDGEQLQELFEVWTRFSYTQSDGSGGNAIVA